MTAFGGVGGAAYPTGFDGGTGSVGRIAIQYQNLTGESNPTAYKTQRQFYAIEQVEQPPYTSTRFYLPESITGGRTYQVQFGRFYTFGAAGQNTKLLRLKRQVYSAASLDSLVSNTGAASGTLNLCLDFGNDGVCDFIHNANTTFPATLNATGLANALNTYLLGRTDVAWGSNVDVPVRVQVDRQADVMLTNLALTPVGAKTRFLRLPAEAYSDLTLSLKFGQSGTPAGALAFTVDVGADGVVDWSYSGSHSFPVDVASPNLATAFNSYLSGRTGDVDVPIRIVPSPSLETALANFTATPSARPDLSLALDDISFNPPAPVETDEITVSALLRNAGSRDSGPVIASFFAALPGGREWYIGSRFVANVPAGGVATTPLQWVTDGFTGDVPVRVVIDPFNRVAETNENNNQASKTLTIKTRPDLRLTPITLGDPEPVAGEAVQVSLSLRNDGQTAAGSLVLALYDGNPDSGGALICQLLDVAVPGNGESAQTCAWTPASPGLHRLFAVADRDRAVNEADESNNQTWLDVYVGFAGPILIDSGGAGDAAYTPALGYGAIDQGQPDVLASCGAEPHQTYRLDPDNTVVYRFDHLLPGHFYHLDLVLYGCGQAARTETVAVNGQVVAGPENLGDGQQHRLSLLLDPALYTRRAIEVTVTEPNATGAIINAISLHDIDYRYADAGGARDAIYSAALGYGALDGVKNTSWGTLPYQSVRIDQSDNEVRYQFDRLDPSLRYQLHLVFYQGAAGAVTEKVFIDGVDTQCNVALNGSQRFDCTIDAPISAYFDHSPIQVTVRRTSSSNGAFVNEISLEQKTQLIVPTISNLSASNVSGAAATLSWTTDLAARGEVDFGATSALGRIAYDDRGASAASRTHFVSLTGLSPSTTYYFYVVSGDAFDDNAGALYQFRTGPDLNLRSPDLAYGQVFQVDGVTPAAGALVRVTVVDRNGSGTPGRSAPMLALVDADGYWNLDLGAARTGDLQQAFIYSPSGDRVELMVDNGQGCGDLREIDTAADAPAPLLGIACPTQHSHPISVGWTLAALNLATDPMPKAQQSQDEIRSQSGDAREFCRWQNGGWDCHVDALPFNNFDIELGRGYFVRATTSSIWTRTGRPPVFPLVLHLVPGWNLVGLPKLPRPLKAEDLLNQIAAQGGACAEIARWANGSWRSHLKGLAFNNYDIVDDEGYFIKCSQTSDYTPSAAALAQESAAWPAPAVAAVVAGVANPTIHDMLITNRRDVALTITWRTDQPSTGWVEYGPTAGLGSVAYDERGEGTASTLHSVTLANLLPETPYFFRLHAGETVADDAGQPFMVATRASEQPTPPAIAYGQVHYQDASPAVGSLLRAWLVSGDGSRFEPLSALVDGWGYWNLSLPMAACDGLNLSLEVAGPAGETAAGLIPACAVQPAPALTLDPAPAYRLHLPMVVR